ncbi:multicopper oxidase domain-containing protein [Nitrososphaera sp.]|uniref:multicopper oxidase domain-containing protein n=1 Tax=Nitrososphaera sp. TaxID=1971748 RepID=UPI0017D46743|nr:multicopper oxidase domain-containing protein [Nitrososphaera sp.]NWG36247.1 multicopper oxidase domain-containing protein [Nitrososphaera sp.]
MNKAIIAGMAAGVLVVGLVFSPLFNSPIFGSAQAQNQGTGVTRHYTMVADEMEVQVAPDNPLHPGGIMYNAMVFNDTIPGPVVAANVGDTIEFTLVNEGTTIHSLDFHAGIGDALSGNVAPGESKTWTLQAKTAGAFLYHCGADGLFGVWEHIANGMYGGIIVHPKREAPAKEFYMVFGEIYNGADKGLFEGAGNQTGSFDVGKLLADDPDLVLTNGVAHKYVPGIGQATPLPLNPDAQVFKVKPGELTRWYIVNPGPNGYVGFHFINGMIDVRDGNVRGNFLGRPVLQDETWTIPPGSASVIEATFPEGTYVGVDHNMSHVLKGAAFVVVSSDEAQPDDHPEGTRVPSKAELGGRT